MQDPATYISLVFAAVALLVSILSYRASNQAQRLESHDLVMECELEYGGVAEIPSDRRPLILTLRLMNRARGEVTVRALAVAPPFPSVVDAFTLDQKSLVSGPVLGHRIGGYDSAEWKFDLRVARKTLRGSWGPEDPVSSSRVVVIAQLGDASQIASELSGYSSSLFWHSFPSL